FVQGRDPAALDARPVAQPQRYGIAAAMATTAEIAALLRRRYGYRRVGLVPVAIDSGLFRPAPEKQLRVVALPRRRGALLAELMRSFAGFMPRHAQVPWDLAEDLSRAELAVLLGQAAVFLALSENEGFGMPPLEAMASGCLVAGFHGGGGLA